MNRREKRKRRGEEREKREGRKRKREGKKKSTCSLIAGPKFSCMPCGFGEKQSLGTFAGKTGA